MEPSDLSRRDFHWLAAAALSGAVAGSLSGCSEAPKPPPAAPPSTTSPANEVTGTAGSSSTGAHSDAVQTAQSDLHICRGLNACKGQGADHKNSCAGQGSCATVEAHSCGSNNTCKGFGGCGASVGQNACKGQGGCHVPLMPDAWTTAREHFEQRMKQQNVKVGPAPAAKT